MKCNVNQLSYYCSTVLFALDQIFSRKQFRKIWIPPNKGFGLSDYSQEINDFIDPILAKQAEKLKEDSEQNRNEDSSESTDFINQYADFIIELLYREKLPATILPFMMTRKDNIVRPIGWPEDCLIATREIPSTEKNKTIIGFLFYQNLFANRIDGICAVVQFRFKLTRRCIYLKVEKILDIASRNKEIDIKKIIRKPEVVIQR